MPLLISTLTLSALESNMMQHGDCVQQSPIRILHKQLLFLKLILNFSRHHLDKWFRLNYFSRHHLEE